MQLRSLELKHFRSYPKQIFEFSGATTVFLGPNTAGKTNVLEAIFLSATGKSFRAERDIEMIAWGEELARVNSRLILGDGPKDLEIMITRGEVGGKKVPTKRYAVNGVPRRSVDFIGNLRIVLFWPEDLELVTDSPFLRRRYLDFILTQIDREYRRSLYSYEKGLRQRNKLLERIRDGVANRSQLIFWDQLLIKTGSYLTQQRQRFIEAVNLFDKPFGDFTIVYETSVISHERFTQYAREEVAAAATLVGPHRDDFLFFELDRDIAKFGSRGEQRLAILWLKLAELEFVAKNTGERPLLLLDDVFSELDHRHREEIVKVTGLQQTLVTTADRHFVPSGLLETADLIELGSAGK